METSDNNRQPQLLPPGGGIDFLLDEHQDDQSGHVILDELLLEAIPQDSDLVDELLELKFALIQREGAEDVLNLFCRLRRRLERRHYLACYRLRRWLEKRIEATVSPGRGYPAHTHPVRLIPRTVDGIANAVLNAARKNGTLTPGGFPRIGFRFASPVPA